MSRKSNIVRRSFHCLAQHSFFYFGTKPDIDFMNRSTQHNNSCLTKQTKDESCPQNRLTTKQEEQEGTSTLFGLLIFSKALEGFPMSKNKTIFNLIMIMPFLVIYSRVKIFIVLINYAWTLHTLSSRCASCFRNLSIFPSFLTPNISVSFNILFIILPRVNFKAFPKGRSWKQQAVVPHETWDSSTCWYHCETLCLKRSRYHSSSHCRNFLFPPAAENDFDAGGKWD